MASTIPYISSFYFTLSSSERDLVNVVFRIRAASRLDSSWEVAVLHQVRVLKGRGRGRRRGRRRWGRQR